MVEHKCPICKGKMGSFGHDEFVCIDCGFVTKKPIVPGKLDVV